MKIIAYRLALLLLSAALLPPARLAAAPAKPNIIFILADDLGYGDLSCYGQQKFKTPHIDQLAAEGLRFTQAYAGSTVCAPSRCALMTGLHTGHAQIRGNREVKPEGQFPIRKDTQTIPTVLRRAGYVSGMFGKWGLGAPGSEGDPMEFFDAFFGYNCQAAAHTFYPDALWRNREKVPLDKKTYSHDLIMDAAFAFIRANKDRPFFCYLSVTIPHASMHAPQALHEKYRKQFPQFEAVTGKYAGPEVVNPVAAFPAMVEHLDNGVGRLSALLKELGLNDNTLVIFTSDNGPHKEGGHDPEFWDSNGPLKGIKRDLYEGGIRVPFIARWPAVIKPGGTTGQITAFWDMLPTFCELAEVPPPAGLDGLSILPTFKGLTQPQHDYLYWEFTERGGSQALRMGDYKAVRLKVAKAPDAPVELYDLASDLGETNNIATQHPGLVRKIEALFQAARTDSETFPLFKK